MPPPARPAPLLAARAPIERCQRGLKFLFGSLPLLRLSGLPGARGMAFHFALVDQHLLSASIIIGGGWKRTALNRAGRDIGFAAGGVRRSREQKAGGDICESCNSHGSGFLVVISLVNPTAKTGKAERAQRVAANARKDNCGSNRRKWLVSLRLPGRDPTGTIVYECQPYSTGSRRC